MIVIDCCCFKSILIVFLFLASPFVCLFSYNLEKNDVETRFCMFNN